MSIPIGVTLSEGLFNTLTGEIYFTVPAADVKLGETVVAHSTTDLGSIAVETEAPAVPKLGPAVSNYDMDLVLKIFGELG